MDIHGKYKYRFEYALRLRNDKKKLRGVHGGENHPVLACARRISPEATLPRLTLEPIAKREMRKR